MKIGGLKTDCFKPMKVLATPTNGRLPEGLRTKRDEISFRDDSVLFYHRNTGETVFDVSVRQQQMECGKELMFDPLQNLTFGGKLVGDDFIPAGSTEGEYLSSGYKGWKVKK